MNYVLFDVETTGLTSNDEIIQFAAVVLNSRDFSTIQRLEDFYCMSTIPIKKAAQSVHGISPGLLVQLSDKQFFEDRFLDFYEYYSKDTIWVNYSNTLFDFRMINQTLSNGGVDMVDFGTRVYDFSATSGLHHLDLMSLIAMKNKGTRRAYSLANALKDTPGFTQEGFDRLYNNFCLRLEQLDKNHCLNLPKLPVEYKKTYHNARYDAFAMWYLLKFNNI